MGAIKDFVIWCHNEGKIPDLMNQKLVQAYKKQLNYDRQDKNCGEHKESPN